MKNMFKNPILMFILGAIIFSSITVYATVKYQASEIEYNDTPLNEVLDDLYNFSGQSNENVSIRSINITASTNNENKMIVGMNPTRVVIDCPGIYNYSYPSHMEWTSTSGYTKSSSNSSAGGTSGNISVNGNMIIFSLPYVVNSNPNSDNCTMYVY